MATYRFNLNQEYSDRLEAEAIGMRMTVQEYIRYKIFGETTIFSVDELVTRIQNGDFINKEFTVPDAYSDEEWSQIDRGNAGVLGKNFFNQIKEHPELGIRFIEGKTIKRRAVYTYLGPKTINEEEE